MNEMNGLRIAMNTKESLRYLGLKDRGILDSYRRAGLIRAVKVGRTYLYPVSELNAFINKNIGKEISKDGIIYG